MVWRIDLKSFFLGSIHQSISITRDLHHEVFDTIQIISDFINHFGYEINSTKGLCLQEHIIDTFSCRLWKYFFIVFRIILHKSSKRNYQITTSTHVYRLSYSWGSFENTRIWPFLFWKPLSILHLIVMHENFFMCLRLRWLISEKSWYGLTFHFPHRIKPLYNTI